MEKQEKNHNDFAEKELFVSDVSSLIAGLELQRKRIFNLPQIKQSFLISPIHDVDFYVIILRRIFRKIEDVAKEDSRVANLKGKNKEFLNRIKIRDHFEHGIDIKKLPAINASSLPGFKKSVAGAISNIKIATSLCGLKIISGKFHWDLHEDHEKFIQIIKNFIKLYPFTKGKK